MPGASGNRSELRSSDGTIFEPPHRRICPEEGFINGDWISRLRGDDSRTLGRNDRENGASARLSELDHSIYRISMEPLVRAPANQPATELARKPNPRRLSFTMFAPAARRAPLRQTRPL